MCAPAAPAVMTGSPGAQPQPHCCSSHPAGVLVELISNISLPFGERVHRLYSKKFLIFKCESALELNNNKKKIQLPVSFFHKGVENVAGQQRLFLFVLVL